MRSVKNLLLVIPALLLVTAAAKAPASSIPLPDDFAHEGIATGAGNSFYVGSLKDGDVYAGDLRTGQGRLLVDAPAGRVAVGMTVEDAHGRLWVAGGSTGHGYVYDARTGDALADITLTTGASLVNDVTVTKDAAYFTDSFNPLLYVVPIGPGGALGVAQTLEVTGPASARGVPVGLNGITATPNGKTLIVAHSELGQVFTVDPASGVSTAIEVPPGSITPGTPDGILLDGRTLWVVENFANRLVGLRLSPDLASGTLDAVLTDDDVAGRFRVPSTVAEHGNTLALVNARFDLGLPP
ncbi:MAG: hypothetical protein WCG47_31515, partial [Dermatophilaceae bacterium]